MEPATLLKPNDLPESLGTAPPAKFLNATHRAQVASVSRAPNTLQCNPMAAASAGAKIGKSLKQRACPLRDLYLLPRQGQDCFQSARWFPRAILRARVVISDLPAANFRARWKCRGWLEVFSGCLRVRRGGDASAGSNCGCLQSHGRKCREHRSWPCQSARLERRQ